MHTDEYPVPRDLKWSVSGQRAHLWQLAEVSVAKGNRLENENRMQNIVNY